MEFRSSYQQDRVALGLVLPPLAEHRSSGFTAEVLTDAS